MTRAPPSVTLRFPEIPEEPKKRWCIADLTPEYLARMEDVLALYERPVDPAAPVVCCDERPLVLHADVRAPRPARPGHVAKQDKEYARRGTANLFGIVEPKTGRHWNRVTPDRSGVAFARVIRDVVTAYPDARTIHLVLDNLNIHHEGSLIRAFGPRDGHRLWQRLTVHYTPTHGSWLNQAELELSLIARQALGRDRIPTRAEMAHRVRAWTRRANRRRACITRRFTANWHAPSSTTIRTPSNGQSPSAGSSQDFATD